MPEMKKLNVLITSFLEPEHVERVRQLDQRLNVIYDVSLVRPPRYPADHKGQPGSRTPEEEARWRAYLSQADILFDIDPSHLDDLPELAPNVKWIQSSSTGIGQFIHEARYDQRMPGTVFTMAGIHARPLAEFCMMALLMNYKKVDQLNAWKQEKHFERYATTDTEGRKMAIVGLGRNGTAVARLAKAFDMVTVGTNLQPKQGVVDQFYPLDQMHEMLKDADVLVLAVPPTPKTNQMIGAAELALLKKGAFFINICRASVVDEVALVEALNSGQLSGAAIDVFAIEPLPEDSPYWTMPNVLICPHSASCSDRENGRLMDVFCENLRRYLDGKLLNFILNTELTY